MIYAATYFPFYNFLHISTNLYLLYLVLLFLCGIPSLRIVLLFTCTIRRNKSNSDSDSNTTDFWCPPSPLLLSCPSGSDSASPGLVWGRRPRSSRRAGQKQRGVMSQETRRLLWKRRQVFCLHGLSGLEEECRILYLKLEFFLFFSFEIFKE